MADSSKNKILFLINKLGVGGAERVFIKDANALMEKGFDVYFAFLFGKIGDQLLLSELNLDNHKLFYCGSSGIYDLKAIKKLSNFVREKNIETVYSTLNESNIIARFIKIFNPKIKIFIREANIAGPKPFHFKILDVVFNFFVEKIICVSSEVLDSLRAYQPFYSHKMVVLMNGVDIPENFKKYPENIELPLKLLSVGSLTPKKGHRFLIKSLGLVNKKHRDSFLLTIIGEGIEQNSIEKLLKESGIENRVKIIKPISKSELAKYYLGNDLFVLSSIHEGCPNVLLEASSFGLASVATNVSGVSNIIENNINGKVVKFGDSEDLADAICYMIENRNDFFAKYGRNSRQTMIKNFSNNVRLAKLISIIE